MIDVKTLKSIIKKKGFTQKEVAIKLGISKSALSSKLNKGVFGSEDIEKLIRLLDITNPLSIFFVK
jgi:transcriptional regulator with XRE-family HTH domain